MDPIASSLALMAGQDLIAQLDVPLPSRLAVGSGTAVFVAGWCVAPSGPIRGLCLVVDGVEQPVAAFRMPRRDVFDALHPDGDRPSRDDPGSTGYRSGFWGTARIAARDRPGPINVAVRAALADGRSADAQLATIEVDSAQPRVHAAAPAGTDPLVAICMATFNPPPDLLVRQLESIRAQTHRNWVAVVSDDRSDPEAFARLEDAIGGDPRFVLSRSEQRLGFYRNFERALALAPAGAQYVAMADQDDAWHPDKLEVLLAEIGGAQLVYSDARVVSRDGDVLAGSYWGTRRNNHSDLTSLLVANAVTGAASLIRSDLLDVALPFPPAQFAHYHDHWVGLTALCLGDVAFVERPLYDYVQHGSASLGHAAATTMPSLRSRVGALGSDPRDRIRRWRLHYFADVCRLMQVATILRMRCDGALSWGKRRRLDAFLRADRSLPQLVRLWLRGLRDLVGRPETLGAEWRLAQALLWRRLASATAREQPGHRLHMEALPPSSLVSPPRSAAAPPAPVRAIAEKVAPLNLAIRADAPERINVLIPSVDLKHLFGGYIAKFNLARRMAALGARVRIVTVDPQGPLPSSWRRDVESFAGLEGLFGTVEIAFGREGLEVSPADRFVASTWWSAHIAADAATALGAERFAYLIQEYEPFTFPMGSYAALADASYRLPHAALFSTELLRDYFRRHGLGVFAQGEAAGDRASAAFENAITAVDAPSAHELAARSSRRLLFYARPEPHAARNLYELGVLALEQAVATGAFDGWELDGIGTVDARRSLELGSRATLSLLPRSAQAAYAQTLRDHDVGLALMYTPHPSLVPIEMASAGMLTVTNTFENKTADALAQISPNLLAAEPTVDAIAQRLVDAATAAGDSAARAAGGEVRWSRDWDRSFDDELVRRVLAWLR
jgi:glycosyltransferase involved in cell wall biosynthesis